MYLPDRLQFDHVNRESASHTRVGNGVPQGPTLEPLLFTLHGVPSGTIFSQHGLNVYYYADAARLRRSMKPDETCKLTVLKT